MAETITKQQRTKTHNFEVYKQKLYRDGLAEETSFSEDNRKNQQCDDHVCPTYQDNSKENLDYNTELRKEDDCLTKDKSVSSWQENKKQESSCVTPEIDVRDSNFTMTSANVHAKIKQADDSCLPPEVTSVENAVDRIRKHLQLTYKKMVLPALFPWLPRRFAQLQGYLRNVKLSMIAADANGVQISTPVETIAVKNIFDNINGLKPTRIQIQDTVGFNSSALAVALCRSWALGEGEVAAAFDLVVYLQGCDLYAEGIDSMIMKSCRVDADECLAVLEAFATNSKVLFVLDDVDNAQLDEPNDVLQILNSRNFAQSTLLVTSASGTKIIWVSPLIEIQSPQSCIKILTIAGVSQEVESTFLQTNLPRQVRNENDFAILLANLKPFFSDGELHNPFFLLLVIQVFSKANIKEAKTKTESYKMIFQHLFGKYYKTTKQNTDVELFDFETERIPVGAKLLSQFGEIALLCIAENKLVSKPKNIVNICNIDDSIHDLGLFLYKETKYSSLNSTCTAKRDRRFDVELIHPLLLHFTIAYHLWMAFTNQPCNLFLKRLAFFKTTMGQDLEATHSICSFLFGLIGNKVERFINTLTNVPDQYGDWIKELLYQRASAVVDFDNPFTVNHWMEYQDQLTISAHLLGTIPHNLKLRHMCLDMPGDELIQHDSITCSIQCDHLWCILKGSAEQGDILLQFLNVTEFQELSIVCKYSNEYNSNWLHWLHQEFLNGNMKHAHVSYLCLHIPYDQIYEAIPLLNNLLCHDAISALALTILPSNSVTLIDKQNRQARFYQHIKQRLPQLILPYQQQDTYTAEDCINSFIQSAGKSEDLHSIKLSFLFKSDGLTVNMDQLCQFGLKSWRSVELSHCLVASNTHVQNRDIAYLDYSATQGVESNAAMLFSYKVRALKISTSNLKTIQNLLMHDEDNLTELQIQINSTNPEADMFQAFLHFRNIQILSLMVGSYHIMVDKIFFYDNKQTISLKGIEIFNAHSNEAYDFTSQVIHHLNECDSSLECTPKLKLNYLLFRFMLDKDFFNGDETIAESPTNYFLKCIKSTKDSLKLDLLKEIHVICRVGALSRLKTLEDIFPSQEGFTMERDFWGMKECDTEFSKCIYDFTSMMLWHRLVIKHQ